MSLSDEARSRSGLSRWSRRLTALTPLLLASCSAGPFRLFDPKGPVAGASLIFTVTDVAVMATIIVPTALFILWCLWRYRRSRSANYDPNFTHSTKLEILLWGVPVLTVAGLFVVSFIGTFAVDPYGPHVLHTSPKSGNSGSLTVDVIATDWQWIFVYPKQHVATVDRLVVPAHRNIDFRLTSTSVVNNFFIPQLTDMIDVMPGMRTKDAMRANHKGRYEGFSANFSGAGFAWMRFETDVVSRHNFAKFVVKTGQSSKSLTYADFEHLARPTINIHETPLYFTAPAPNLFSRVIQAARNGKTYPVPARLTENMAHDLHANAVYFNRPVRPNGKAD